MERREILALGALLAGAATGVAQEAAGQEFFVSRPQPSGEQEKRILGVLEGMQDERRRMQSVPMDDGRLLRLLAEFAGAKQVVEIGTSQGMSALWFSMALARTGGKLATYEIDEGRAKIARENFEKAGVSEVVTLVLGDAHEKVQEFEGAIDLLFLDADKQGYVDYLRTLLPKIRPGGLIAAHNITPRMADPKFLAAINNDPALDSLLVHLSDSGISLALKKR